MSWIAVAVAGTTAALGVGKSYLVDKPKEERQRKLAAETQRYSPWTQLKAGPIEEADPFGTGLQYGVAGFGLANSAQAFQSDQALKKAQTDLLNRSQTIPFSGAKGNAWRRLGTPGGFQNWSAQDQADTFGPPTLIGNRPRESTSDSPGFEGYTDNGKPFLGPTKSKAPY